MPPIKALPPTSLNFTLHIKHAHLQVMLWKATDKRAPPDEVCVGGAGWCSFSGYSYRLSSTSLSYERAVTWVQVRAGM